MKFFLTQTATYSTAFKLVTPSSENWFVQNPFDHFPVASLSEEPALCRKKKMEALNGIKMLIFIALASRSSESQHGDYRTNLAFRTDFSAAV